jgi:hypothetical protein
MNASDRSRRSPLVFALAAGTCALALGVATIVWWMTQESATSRIRTVSAAPVPGDTSLERVRALEQQLAELQRRLDFLEHAPSLATSAPERVAAPSDTAPRSSVEEHTERTPRWYLEQYVRSFGAHPGGSQHFRRRVEEYAPELASEIATWIQSRAAPMPLRASLVEMFSDVRFKGIPVAIDALLRAAAVVSVEDLSLCSQCFDGLSAIGDAATARVIEGMLWSLPYPNARAAALGAMLALDGDANPALERLLATARSDADRLTVLEHLQPASLTSALSLLQTASFQGIPVRTAAAHVAIDMHGHEAMAFVDDWLAREPDSRVREILAHGRADMLQAQPYSPAQALGPPNTPLGEDDPRAWAYAQTSGVHWIELGFEPRIAHALRVHVNFAPGGIARITLLDEHGAQHVVFEGLDPCSAPGVCAFVFSTTSKRIRGVRIALDADRVQSWCEIDAVELVGPSGSGWATAASASSYYGN